MNNNNLKINKYYYIKMNKFCSFNILIKDIARNGDFLGITNYNHCYKFKNSDSINCIEITKTNYINE